MNVAPGNVTLVVKIRAGALTGEAAKPKPLTANRSWEAPPAQGPTERQRLAERAHLDRDIVYFLQEPTTNAFFLYHDYTESRPGVDKYINVVRSWQPGVESVRADPRHRRGTEARNAQGR